MHYAKIHLDVENSLVVNTFYIFSFDILSTKSLEHFSPYEYDMYHYVNEKFMMIQIIT